MSSILTNASSMTALQSLRAVNTRLATSQNQVSTGFRISEASHNAAYWSISTTMRSDVKAIGAVQDALGLSAARLDVTTAAVKPSIEIMAEITAKLVVARGDGVDKTKINEELTQLRQQLQTTMDAASFNGQNWLSWNTGEDSLDKELVSSFIRDSAGNVRVGTINYRINTPPPRTDTNVQYFVDNGGSGEYGILSSEAFAVQAGSDINYVLIRGATAPATAIELTLDNSTTSEQIDDMINTVEAMTRQMVNVAAQLGAVKNRVDNQNEFATKLADAMERGIGQLVDTDMNKASSRLAALQTQQQLAIQSLQIANSNPQTIMQLFQ